MAGFSQVLINFFLIGNRLTDRMATYIAKCASYIAKSGYKRVFGTLDALI